MTPTSTTFNQGTAEDPPAVALQPNPNEPFGRRWQYDDHFPPISADVRIVDENEVVPIVQAVNFTYLPAQRWNEILVGDQSFIQSYYGFPDQAASSLRFQGVRIDTLLPSPGIVRTIHENSRAVPVGGQTVDENNLSIASPWMPNILPPSNLDNPRRDHPQAVVPARAVATPSP